MNKRSGEKMNLVQVVLRAAGPAFIIIKRNLHFL